MILIMLLNLIQAFSDEIKNDKPRNFWDLLKLNEKKSNYNYKHQRFIIINFKRKIIIKNEKPGD